MNITVIGNGSDGGGYQWRGNKLVKIPPWNPELLAAINVLRASGDLKSPELAEATAKAVAGYVEKELGGYLKEGGVVVFASH